MTKLEQMAATYAHKRIYNDTAFQAYLAGARAALELAATHCDIEHEDPGDCTDDVLTRISAYFRSIGTEEADA